MTLAVGDSFLSNTDDENISPTVNVETVQY
jgi:hypothetical protein